MKILILILIILTIIVSSFGSYINFFTRDNTAGTIYLLLVIANIFNLWIY